MIGVSARALGALPVFALSTLPGATAIILSRGHLLVAFAVAAALGSACGAGGYLLAFFKNLPVGGAQTLAATGLFAAALLARLAIHGRKTRPRS
jgi:zinc transport system permease protein